MIYIRGSEWLYVNSLCMHLWVDVINHNYDIPWFVLPIPSKNVNFGLLFPPVCLLLLYSFIYNCQ